VVAILSGAATQTRRLVLAGGRGELTSCDASTGVAIFRDSTLDSPAPLKRKCGFGAVGDRLFVQETWATVIDSKNEREIVIYRADMDVKDEYTRVRHGLTKNKCWRAPEGMTREQSRIEIEVTELRVERLQAITADDVRAEGFLIGDIMPGVRNAARAGEKELAVAVSQSLLEAYAQRWNDAHIVNVGWEKNPWVWVIGFVYHTCDAGAGCLGCPACQRFNANRGTVRAG
jgi:hypothetical protein